MKLKEKLEIHYKAFDKSRISPDPLEMLHYYKNDKDIEVIGLISSIFAYGNIKQIIKSQRKIVEVMGNNPHEFILNFNRQDESKLKIVSHRFYTGNDTLELFKALKFICNEHGSLKDYFLKFYNVNDKNLKDAIQGFSQSLIDYFNRKKILSRGLRFMFPLPSVGSACKRINLFLRWMVRKDELDFGLWNEVPASKLVIPVDTHIARICKQLKLTHIQNVSWNMAEEITDNLRKFDPNDPVKYDFAICHIGMRKLKF